MRSVVQSFFRELGISQQQTKVAHRRNPSSAGGAAGEGLAVPGLSAVGVAQALRKFVPSHTIRQVHTLLEKHLVASAHQLGSEEDTPQHPLQQQLYSIIGESVLQQAIMRAAAGADESGSGAFTSLGAADDVRDASADSTSECQVFVVYFYVTA